ncbi:Gibberellin regulated protein [Artemisia annua]|uniref:Gibberellin regulated protein n=1 Tax=Artemisia annua TaxID=35608 RepID=A0A2U1N411_ARTAN|nr:Gibberellin regulated protein [Artemisia annua]
MKPSFVVLLILAILFTSSVFESINAISPTSAPVSTPSKFGCDKKCELRCSRSGWRDRCLKYCGICCGKCNGCVPSSPYVSKSQCPCYRDMKNPKGKDKCP